MQRALRLLEAVASHEDGAPAKQLARETGLPLPTTYHLLRTLTHEGYLAREKGVFLLGEAAVRLAGGRTVQNRRIKIEDALARWRDEVGLPVYFALYREGEIELVAVADTPSAPAVEEWADFGATGHAHAIGQCLLSQLDPKTRQEHLDRHPAEALTPYTLCNRRALLERLGDLGEMEPLVERQEYARGTVCAAIPLAVGPVVGALAISLPLHQEERLLPAIGRLRSEVEKLVDSFDLSISI